MVTNYIRRLIPAFVRTADPLDTYAAGLILGITQPALGVVIGLIYAYVKRGKDHATT
jgi:hypothetical protein